MALDALSERRQLLDEPPRRPPARRAPSSGIQRLGSPTGADESVADPEGEATDADDPESNDANSQAVLKAFKHLQKADEELQGLFAVAPEVGQAANDLLSTLKQIVPVWAAGKLSNPSAVSSSSGGGMPPGASSPQPPPQMMAGPSPGMASSGMGMGQLAGMGGGGAGGAGGVM